MSVADALERHFADHFRVLVLDNEVTVDAFVTDPPLPWLRLVSADGAYQVADGYPTQLTMAEADREELNWDRVSNGDIVAALSEMDERVDLVAFGNNAAQGMPLANAYPVSLRGAHGAVIYGSSLPEQSVYETIGYSQFCARTDLLELAGALSAGRPLALAFINTIEHNDQNYHTPWPGG
ncbi:MAG: hypothetical protein HOM58_10710 [Rhodospirillaceae bacterium]|jgi:hypothetical protein|nr:hypothetical protein [Rhodospirillaceae bacterium]MBT5458650.1 hypothetical protein [Rhodospirillaceae bacterium]